VPLFTFICPSCRRNFELFLRPSEMGSVVKCLHCGAEVKEPPTPTEEAERSQVNAVCGPSKVT
jgi:putative FmdB family regulatory protein